LQLPIKDPAVFYGVALLLGLVFAYFGLEFVIQKSRVAARRLLAASIVYLPALFALSTLFCRLTRS
jgi:heme O synthase-like polyprenyltransferase